MRLYLCFSFFQYLSLVTMAKGIGNGFPLAAVVTTPGTCIHLAHFWIIIYLWKQTTVGPSIVFMKLDHIPVAA